MTYEHLNLVPGILAFYINYPFINLFGASREKVNKKKEMAAKQLATLL